MRQKYIEGLEKLIPNCITEEKDENGNYHKAVNMTILKRMLSDDILENSEAYVFTWVGKDASILEANKATMNTIRPCKNGSKNWNDTNNLYIEGDNLEALKILQESYFEKVDIIYIDPPYNTGNDFIYKDLYFTKKENYENALGLFDSEDNRLFKNTDTNGRFHSDWCSMIYSRLLIARTLLSEKGIVFISIGEEEIASLIKICDELFGEDNRISVVTRVMKNASNMGNFFTPSTDYVLCYAKSITKASHFKGEVDSHLYKKEEVSGPRKGEFYRDDVAFFQSGLKHGGSRYPITCPDGERVNTPDNKPWRMSEQTFNSYNEKNMIVFKKTTTSPLIDEDTGEKAHWNLYTKSYLSDRQETGTQPRNILLDYINRKGADLLKQYGIPFDFAKPVDLLTFLIKIVNDKDAVVMDFFFRLSYYCTSCYAA